MTTPILHHMPYAICAQKVRIALHEKEVEWESRDVGQALRSPEYLKLNPGGYVPTLVDGERVVTESRVISEYVDDRFAGPALAPADPYARAEMRLWSKQIDDSLHLNVFILSFVANLRAIFLAMPDAVRARALPFDSVKRERVIDMLEADWESTYIPGALARFAKLIADMESRLSRSPWLAGEAYSLADADFTPYLDRLSDLGLSFLWEEAPATTDWLARVRSRPSFAEVTERWVSPEMRARNAALGVAAGHKFRALHARAAAA